MLHIPFTVVTIDGIDESYPENLPPEEVSEYIANKKLKNSSKGSAMTS